MAVFGASSSFPPLEGTGGRLVWSADEKASMFSVHCGTFSSTVFCCHPVVRCALLDLDAYNGSDPDEMSPLFYKQVARELALNLAVIFRHLVKEGSFLVC